MRKVIHIVSLLLIITSCQSQIRQETDNQLVGGPCEGCEAIYEYGDRVLTSATTLPEYANSEPKLKLTGTVFQKDGVTPARDVIIYIYHTDRGGIYKSKPDAERWAKRHGYFRGWVRTGKDGKYTFHTFRPASYPNRAEPEHIHITIKEPDKNEYYIDSYVFSDDPLLTQSKKSQLKNRGGSGIVSPRLVDGIYLIHRDIVLGENIPDYN